MSLADLILALIILLLVIVALYLFLKKPVTGNTTCLRLKSEETVSHEELDIGIL